MWRRCSFGFVPLRRFFVERGGALRGALAFFLGDELPQFLGVADHRAGGRRLSSS
mgnify:CR=1 FL=1